jgi:hypothetical protein
MEYDSVPLNQHCPHCTTKHNLPVLTKAESGEDRLNYLDVSQ